MDPEGDECTGANDFEDENVDDENGDGLDWNN